MANSGTLNLEEVRKGKKNAPKSGASGRGKRAGGPQGAEKKEPVVEVVRIEAKPHHHKKNHMKAAERHRAERGLTPPPGAFEGYAESRKMERSEAEPEKKRTAQSAAGSSRGTEFTKAADSNKPEFNFDETMGTADQTPAEEPAAPRFAEGQPPAEGRIEKLKQMPARALEAVKESRAAAAVRNTVHKGLESRAVRAVRNHPARAGLIAAGMAGLAAAAVAGTRAVRRKREKNSAVSRSGR